jgi:hypothetical protein
MNGNSNKFFYFRMKKSNEIAKDIYTTTKKIRNSLHLTNDQGMTGGSNIPAPTKKGNGSCVWVNSMPDISPASILLKF